MTTLQTNELRLRFAVFLLAVPAFVATPTRATRFDNNARHTRHLRLVFNVTPQLCKRPIADLPTHFLVPAVSSLPNPRKVFDGQCLFALFRVPHHLLSDAMIHVFYITLLLFRRFLQAAPGAFRPALLQTLAMTAHLATQRPHLVARIRFAFAGNAQLHDAKVQSNQRRRAQQIRLLRPRKSPTKTICL